MHHIQLTGSACLFRALAVRLIKTIRKKNPATQLLLFSATFNEKVKQFAIKIAPMGNQVFVPKEKLSLDVIKQYNVRWVRYDGQQQCPSGTPWVQGESFMLSLR